MNFCAIDWTELIKILTPFIIAFAVYRVWHNQKGKEVVANVAKELIMDISELITTSVLIHYSIAKNDEEYEDLLLQFKTLNIKSIRAMKFLVNTLEDNALKSAQEEYSEKCGKIMKNIREYSQGIQNKTNNHIVSKEEFDDINRTSNALMDALKRYAMYKAKFKFKK